MDLGVRRHLRVCEFLKVGSERFDGLGTVPDECNDLVHRLLGGRADATVLVGNRVAQHLPEHVPILGGDVGRVEGAEKPNDRQPLVAIIDVIALSELLDAAHEQMGTLGGIRPFHLLDSGIHAIRIARGHRRLELGFATLHRVGQVLLPPGALKSPAFGLEMPTDRSNPHMLSERWKRMTVYTLRVELGPNPPMFAPDEDEEVWCAIEVDETHTLEELHEAIFEAFDRWDAHMYEFMTYDEDGITTRSYAMPETYEGEPSWPAMEPEQIDRAISQVGADDEPEEAKERFRDLRRNPPEEGNAGETTIADLNPEELGWIYYQFDFGDSWEHVITIEDPREGSLDGDPEVVETHGPVPPQYRDPNE